LAVYAILTHDQRALAFPVVLVAFPPVEQISTSVAESAQKVRQPAMVTIVLTPSRTKEEQDGPAHVARVSGNNMMCGWPEILLDPRHLQQQERNTDYVYGRPICSQARIRSLVAVLWDRIGSILLARRMVGHTVARKRGS
jgi:hypothetical protein